MKYPSKTIEAITEFIFLETKKTELVPSDLVLVLGNDLIRQTTGVIFNLYQSGKIKENAKIILNGATGELTAGQALECDALYDCAVKEYHMPPELFIKEPKATNAYQNFLYSKEKIQLLGGFEKFESILCIGNAFLMRRASMYAGKLDYPQEKMQYCGVVDRNGRNIGADSWWKSEVAISRVMAEVERIGKYYASGNLDIF